MPKHFGVVNSVQLMMRNLVHEVYFLNIVTFDTVMFGLLRNVISTSKRELQHHFDGLQLDREDILLHCL